MITVHDLWKSYRGVAVLKGLSLTVPACKTMIILGRSGVGKSVLLRQIIGIERPDSGYVEVDGMRLGEQNIGKKTIGMLFQSSALFDSMTVGDNVAFYFTEHRGKGGDQGGDRGGGQCAGSELKDRVDEALVKVGLKDYQNKMPSELSGGQKRRAALARLIIYRPKIMLCDEPTTGLDPITAMQINELIAATHQELGATTIIVTHDILSALTLGDLFAMHHDGKITSVDTKEDFVQSKNPLIVEFLQNASIYNKSDIPCQNHLKMRR